ncbi:hypothetical protein [Mesorhizobium sp. M2D.F.Ca.ET.223.01.1.1]|uniref:hypothetical protein n=1 Tax=Mesorhizobium sp. M2D.F.Ca.ET.223.01.1.1 TaxID=2563940 RepID=UPI001AED3231|nr:hypothetical protein [Mesorhizobium sp. M2D.F.Ca.ET.223.01.1.1]
MNEILANLMVVLDEEHAHAVVEHRRFTIKKPLTAYAAKLLAGKLAAWGNANEAADIMIERCWRGFEVEWMRRASGKNGRRTFADVAMDRFNHGSAGFQGTDADAGIVPTDQRQPGPDGERLRIGGAGRIVPSHH